MIPAPVTPPPGPEPITLLGATGALGRLAFAELLAAPERFRPVGLGAGRQGHQLADLARACHAQWGSVPRLAVADEQTAEVLRRELRPLTSVSPEVGDPGLAALAGGPHAGRVICVVGGLTAWPAVAAAVEAGHHLVVSSKEVLALAGDWFRRRAQQRGGSLRVLDSELTAAERLLREVAMDAPQGLILPATGGPFRHRSVAELTDVTPAQALAHPVWSMGPKISVDSATLVNKALETVVAHRLLGIPPARITVVIHPEARVHALVADGAGREWGLQAPPDMRIPLRHLLGLPTPEARVVSPRPEAGGTFAPVDPVRFPGAILGHRALERGPGGVAALVGADEAAVAAFVAGRLPFLELVPTLARCISRAPDCPEDPASVRAAAEAARDRLADRWAG